MTITDKAIERSRSARVDIQIALENAKEFHESHPTEAKIWEEVLSVIEEHAKEARLELAEWKNEQAERDDAKEDALADAEGRTYCASLLGDF